MSIDAQQLHNSSITHLELVADDILARWKLAVKAKELLLLFG